MKLAAGQIDEAQHICERVLGRDSKNPDAHLALAEVYSEQANNAGMFKQMGLARSALRELEAAVAADPNNGDAHWG
jgi:Tfp pilus assembly protein PilF